MFGGNWASTAIRAVVRRICIKSILSQLKWQWNRVRLQLPIEGEMMNWVMNWGWKCTIEKPIRSRSAAENCWTDEASICVKTSGDVDVSAESAVCSYISPQSFVADFSLYKWRGSDLLVGNVQRRNYHWTAGVEWSIENMYFRWAFAVPSSIQMVV